MNSWRSLLPNAWYVAVREFRGRVRTRSFAAGTLILMAIGFGVTLIPVVIDVAMSQSQTKVAVVASAANLPSDAQNLLTSAIDQSSADTGSIELIWLAPSAASQAETDLKAGTYAALLTIDRASDGSLAFGLRTDMPADGRQVAAIRTALPLLAVEDRLHQSGTSLAGVAAVKLDVQPVNPGEASKSNNLSTQISGTLLTTGLVVLIFMAIVTYGMWVSMSVAEEKGSRVMELMLNATTPLQMLTGKVLGNGAAGLLQYGLILASVLVGVVAQGPIRQRFLGGSGSTDLFAGLSPAVFVWFLILFVGGFLFYSLLYAALGSLVSRQEDVQSATSPLTAIVMLGYFVSIGAINGVNEVWIKIASYIPFFSPYLMLSRIANGNAAPWELALTVVLLVLAIAVALVVAARIYSAGVLLYGQRVGLIQILKMARVAR